MAEQRDGLELLIQDHRAVDQMFTMIQECIGEDATRAQEMTRDVIDSLTLHSQVEEELLYPMAREVVGEADIDEALAEQQEVDDLMDTLGMLAPEDDEFVTTFDELVSNVQTHVDEEENEMFPRLREKLGAERLAELGRGIMQIKQGVGERAR